MKRKGFTLVELLVVIAIIAVLMSMLMPALNKAKEQAKKVWCQADIRGAMICTRTYSLGNEEYLPYNGYYSAPRVRNWPHLGMLDFHMLLANEGLDLRKMHCPSDIEKPGRVAAWWRKYLGGPMDQDDHFDVDGDGSGDVPIGVDAEVDYSYYWAFKMYNDVEDKGNGLEVVSRKKGWRIDDIRYPARNVVTYCLTLMRGYGAGIDEYPWPHSPKQLKMNQCGFIDAHVALIPSITGLNHKGMANLYPGHDPTKPDYNFDWTPGGIKGWDVK